MLEALFDFLINFFFWIVGIVGSIVIYPIQALLVTLIPGLGDFIGIFLGFFNTYIFPTVSFIKELVLDVSCLPRGLWSIFVAFFLARWAIAPAIRSIKLVINSWRIAHGGVTSSGSHYID